MFSIKKANQMEALSLFSPNISSLHHSCRAKVSCNNCSLLLMMRDSVEKPSGWRFSNVQVQDQDGEIVHDLTAVNNHQVNRTTEFSTKSTAPMF